MPSTRHFADSAETLVARNFVAVALKQAVKAAWQAVLPSGFFVHDELTSASGPSPKGSSRNATPGTSAVPKKAVVHASPPTDEHELQ